MTSPDPRTNARGAIILAIAIALGQFAIRPASAPGFSGAWHARHSPSAPAGGPELALPVMQARPAGEVARGFPAVTFTIPLATLDEVRRLDQRPEIADILRTARRYSEARIHLAAYVTAEDAPDPYAEALGVADSLVIEVGIYLARRGVEADRISGKGMGVDSAIGRAVVVSFDVTPSRLSPPSPPRSPWWPARTGAAAPFSFVCTGLSL